MPDYDTREREVADAEALNAADDQTAYSFALSLIRESRETEAYDWRELKLADIEHALNTVGAYHLEAYDVQDELVNFCV
jgi:hypothetical protein